MEIISHGRELIKCEGKEIKAEGLSNEKMIEKLKKHYKFKKDVYTWSFYKNDKGNLVLSITEIYPVFTDKRFKELVANYKKRIEEINQRDYTCYRTERERINAKRMDKQVQLETFNYQKKDKYLCPEGIEDYKIKSKRLIFKSPTELYYTNTGIIRRINIEKKGKQIISFFIQSLLESFFFWDEKQAKTFDSRILDAISMYYPNLKFFLSNFDTSKINPLQLLTLSFEMPNSTLPKYIIKEVQEDGELNCQKLRIYFSCYNAGIKDINVIKQFVQNGFSIEDTDVYYYHLLKKYYKGKNENVDLIFLNRIKPLFKRWDEDSRKATDSIRMLGQVFRRRRGKYKNKLAPLKEGLLKKSLIDMHDYLSATVRQDIAKINYREYDMKNQDEFEHEVDGYNFILPRNSLEVARMADIFQNCVAGYASRINEKEIILYATNTNEVTNYVRNAVGDPKIIREHIVSSGNYPACIEISKSYETNKDTGEVIIHKILQQNYTLNNHRPEKELAAVTEKYFNMIGASRYHSSYYELPF